MPRLRINNAADWVRVEVERRISILHRGALKFFDWPDHMWYIEFLRRIIPQYPVEYADLRDYLELIQRSYLLCKVFYYPADSKLVKTLIEEIHAIKYNTDDWHGLNPTETLQKAVSVAKKMYDPAKGLRPAVQSFGTTTLYKVTYDRPSRIAFNRTRPWWPT